MEKTQRQAQLFQGTPDCGNDKLQTEKLSFLNPITWSLKSLPTSSQL